MARRKLNRDWLSWLIAAAALSGCHSYVDSTHARVLEEGPAAQYARVFGEPAPSDVGIVNAFVVAYGVRPGVVTTDDFEFELLVPDVWIQRAAKRFYLQRYEGEAALKEQGARREHARPWYAPNSLDDYDLYRDLSSVGYVHMLVQRQAEPDGRRRVFISKH